MLCEICPRKCGADRSSAQGFCRSGEKIRVARAAPHYWEEPCISGAKGSGTVFFSGCSLRCVFCQNYEVSHASLGVDVTEDGLLGLFDSLVEQGVHNINLVTPTHYTSAIVRALERFHSPVPVVWNSSGYESVESLKMLEGLVDIYLPDLKYYDSSVAKKYSGAEDYFEYASAAVLEMHRQVGSLSLDDDGIARRGLLIRHLVLPGNVSQTFKVFGWIAENLPEDTSVSLMRQYVPFGKAKEMPPLDRRLTQREYSMAKKRVLELGFENCYFQKRDSAEEIYIPDFETSVKTLDPEG